MKENTYLCISIGIFIFIGIPIDLPGVPKKVGTTFILHITDSILNIIQENKRQVLVQFLEIYWYQILLSQLSLITHETLFSKSQFSSFSISAPDYVVRFPRLSVHMSSKTSYSSQIQITRQKSASVPALILVNYIHSAAPLYANKSGLNLLNTVTSFFFPLARGNPAVYNPLQMLNHCFQLS